MASNENDGVSRVLVTGASGYIGAHVVHQLMKAGYVVRGTVRDKNNEQKIKPLKELCPYAPHALELVEADLMKEDGWASAMVDCSHVIHVASPFPLNNPANEEEVIRPAVDGTLMVLKAAVVAKVKRVVLTSSVVAISSFEKSFKYTEKEWNTGKNQTAYEKSKIMAERAAWDYVNHITDDNRIELAVINPSFVLGPYLTNIRSSSADVICNLLDHKMPALPSVSWPCIDVRDVARAHINAMTSDAAVGNRHLLVSKTVWFQEIGVILATEFKHQGYNPPTKVIPNFLVKFLALFRSDLKPLVKQLGADIRVDNTRMKEVLKIDPIPIEKTLIDMGYSVIDNGLVKKTHRYKGRSEENPQVNAAL